MAFPNQEGVRTHTSCLFIPCLGPGVLCPTLLAQPAWLAVPAKLGGKRRRTEQSFCWLSVCGVDNICSSRAVGREGLSTDLLKCRSRLSLVPVPPPQLPNSQEAKNITWFIGAILGSMFFLALAPQACAAIFSSADQHYPIRFSLEYVILDLIMQLYYNFKLFAM